MKQLDIAIDFDGTVVTHEFPIVGKNIGAEPVLKRLIENGHRLILYTMRGNSSDTPVILNGNYLNDAIQWFNERGIDLYGIQVNPTQNNWTISPKCYAHLYIDDAALGAPTKRDAELSDRPFIDWNAVEMILEGEGVLPATHEMSMLVRAYMEGEGQKSHLE